jgi:glycosyltransferase involved in cell wall biosynthesis
MPVANPMVSVIIPVCNAGKYLRPCLLSVAEQSLRDIEIICVDDGSTDGSLDVLQRFAARDARFRIVQQANAGAGAARNRGLGFASGTYLSFLDADDTFEPSMLKDACDCAEANHADIVVFRMQKVDERTGAVSPGDFAFGASRFPPGVFNGHDAPDYIFLSFQGWAWNKLFARAFVTANNLCFQEIQRTNDLYFTYTALLAADRIAPLDKVLVHYRVGTGNSLQATNHLAPLDFFKAIDALAEYIDCHGLRAEFDRGFVNFALGSCLYNLRSQHDVATRRLLLNFLRQEGFIKLRLSTYPPAFFMNANDYRQYRAITGPFGKYSLEGCTCPMARIARLSRGAFRSLREYGFTYTARKFIFMLRTRGK